MINIIDTRDSNKLTIVMLHGAACSHEVWLRQLEYLKPYFRVILVDLPGHNKSEGDGFDSIEKYAEVLNKELNEIVSQKFILCGHSMGGAITQMFALKYQERLKGIILCSTGARLRVTHQVFEAIQKDFNLFIDMSVTFSLAPNAGEDVKQVFRNIISKCRPEVAMNDFKACNSFDVMDRLSEIKLPSLILCGEDDLLTPVKYSKFLNQHIAGSEFLSFPSTGHMIMLEQTDQVNLLIKNFLNKL